MIITKVQPFNKKNIEICAPMTYRKSHNIHTEYSQIDNFLFIEVG